jgi:hypothetical protein
VRYLTDGSSLYEVVSEYVVRNYGVAGSFLRGVIVRDCKTEAVMVFGASRLVGLEVVS